MSYRITYHPGFNSDMKRIRHWIQEFTDDSVARRKLAEIRTAIRGLGPFPLRGSIQDDIVPGLRVLPVGDHSVVAFVVSESHQEVHVLAVSYAGGDWIRASRQRV